MLVIERIGVEVDKSPVPDQIYPKTLWEVGEEIAGVLAEIYEMYP